MDVVLGIDIGTTNIKTMALEVGGSMVAAEHTRTPVCRDDYGPVHEPQRIVQEVLGCLNRLLQNGRFRVLALAVTSVGEEGVPLGEDLQPLYPAIVWHDDRTKELARSVFGEDGGEIFRTKTGLVPGWEYTLCKLLWLREHKVWPVYKWLSLSDFVAWFFSGEMALSVSQACRTMIFNLAERCLDEGILDRFSLSPALFPPVRNGGEVLGPMRPATARQLGLDHLPLVAVGGHDHIVGAFSLGLSAMAPDELLDSKGTAEALMCPDDEFTPVRLPGFIDLSCGLQADGSRYYTTASLWSGAGLVGAARLLSLGDLAGLSREAARSEPGSSGLRFCPAGRTSSGMVSGLAGGQDTCHLARCFFEGWSFFLRFLTEQMEAFSRRSFAKVTLCGGGVNVPLALEIQAAVLNKPLEIADVPEAAALGACLLAAKALGIDDTAGRKAIRRPARGGRFIRPRPEWVEVYDGIYRREYLTLLKGQGGG